MTRDDVYALMVRRRDAIAKRDLQTFGQLYAETAVVDSPLVGASITGRAGIIKATETFFAAFPDAIIVEEEPVIDGHRAAILAQVTGTRVGEIMEVPPHHKAFRFRIACLFDVDDDKIVHERRIYDLTGLLVQVGVLKAKPAS